MGVRAQTIRSYEQQGLLLKPAVRSKAGHRLYGAYEVAQLRFTRRAKGESKHWVEGCPVASIH